MRSKLLRFSKNVWVRMHDRLVVRDRFTRGMHSFPSSPLGGETSRRNPIVARHRLSGVPALRSVFFEENVKFFSSHLPQESSSHVSATEEEDDSAVAPSRTQSDGTSPRFYKQVRVGPSPNGNGYVVLLDNRVLKTPAKRHLVLPNRRLALAVAAEWEYQEGKHIRPYTMPIMRLAVTSIDQIPRDRESVISTLLKYFHTDSVLCRAPEPSLLADKQAEVWDPLLSWVETLIGFRPVPSSSLFASEQSIETVSAMERVLREFSDWQLSAIDSLSSSAKSLTIALAIAKGKLPLDSAVDVIRLEEDFQVQEWGFVEGGHDIDIADLKVRIFAASVFLRFLED